MGIIFSQVDYHIELQKESLESSEREGPAMATFTVSNERLRLPVERVERIMKYSLKFKMNPILDYVALHGFFQCCDQFAPGGVSVEQELVYVLWKIFSLRSICYIHEVLACLVLLCDGTWFQRLNLLYDLFKCQGTEEVAYEDIIMMVQVSAVALYKLWCVETDWKQSELNALTETIADEAYTKLEKELDNGVNREEFLNWSQERFKALRNIASPESLSKILASQFE